MFLVSWDFVNGRRQRCVQRPLKRAWSTCGWPSARLSSMQPEFPARYDDYTLMHGNLRLLANCTVTRLVLLRSKSRFFLSVSPSRSFSSPSVVGKPEFPAFRHPSQVVAITHRSQETRYLGTCLDFPGKIYGIPNRRTVSKYNVPARVVDRIGMFDSPIGQRLRQTYGCVRDQLAKSPLARRNPKLYMLLENALSTELVDIYLPEYLSEAR